MLISSIHIDIAGLGIVLCSHEVASRIGEGSDFLAESYTAPMDIVAHLVAGDVVGFGTGTPGSFTLSFYMSSPSDQIISNYAFALRLWIDVRGGGVCVRDLYDLMDWERTCPQGQSLKMRDGYYRLTVCSNTPESGMLGDNQLIDIFVEEVQSPPKLKYAGAPILCQ